MALLLTAVFVVAVVTFIVSRFTSIGWPPTALGLILVSMCLYPALISQASTTQVVGIAPTSPEVRTFTLVLFVIGAVALLSGRGGLSWTLFLPFTAWVAIGMTWQWAGSQNELSGLLQYAVGIVAWICGAYIGSQISGNPTYERLASLWIGIVIGIELVVAVLQALGVRINPMAVYETAILGGRINGTMNHPNTLGKVLVLLIVLTLPLLRSRDPITRTVASASVIGAFVPLALTEGRANFFGALLALILWTLLTPRRQGHNTTAVVLLSAFGVASVFSWVFVARFEEDQSGGVRSQLNEIAMAVIPSHWQFGLGPNSYVSAVGPIWGSWIPVHSTWLLAAAEVGIVGGVALLAPYVVGVIQAWMRRGADDASGDYARSLLASVPAIILIGTTGWGLLGSVVWPMWMFMSAYCYGGMKRKPTRSSRVERAQHESRQQQRSVPR